MKGTAPLCEDNIWTRKKHRDPRTVVSWGSPRGKSPREKGRPKVSVIYKDCKKILEAGAHYLRILPSATSASSDDGSNVNLICMSSLANLDGLNCSWAMSWCEQLLPTGQHPTEQYRRKDSWTNLPAFASQRVPMCWLILPAIGNSCPRALPSCSLLMAQTRSLGPGMQLASKRPSSGANHPPHTQQL